MAFQRPLFLDPDLPPPARGGTFGRLLGIVSGAALAIGALEILFRLLPTSGTLYRSMPTPERPITVWQQGPDQMASVGWNFRGAHRSHINAQGFNSSFDYVAPACGIVVGDSFMEGFMIAEPERFGTRLGDLMGCPGRVYTCAVSGYSVADYLAASEWAVRQYRPKFLVVNLHDSDVGESLRTNPGFLQMEVGTPPDRFPVSPDSGSGGTARVAKSSALVRYVFLNARGTPPAIIDTIGRELGKRPPAPDPGFRPKAEAASRYFVAEMARLQRENGVRVLLQFDADRTAIVADRPARTPHDPLDEMKADATRSGLSVLDLEPIFRDDWRRNRLPLDFQPADGHWTPRTHGIVAEAAATRLRELGIRP